MSPRLLVLSGLCALSIFIKCADSAYPLTKNIGCYTDRRDRQLPKYKGLVKSVSQCVNLCLKAKQRFFGVENSAECWCGQELPKLGHAKNCNKPCHSGEECGGDWALTVYELSYPLTKNIGCYRDRRDRQLPMFKGFVKSVSQCVNLCLKKEQRYIGLENAAGCWCGQELPKLGHAKNCNKPCHSGEECGGAWALTVYELSHPLTKNIGCFKDSKHRVLPMKKGFVNFVSQCVNLCLKAKQRFFGLENAGKCWCGQELPKLGHAKNCNKPCHSGEECGGDYALTVYELEIIGCFHMDQDQLKRVGSVDYVSHCVNNCKKAKQRYAGVEHGSECWCGELPKLGNSKECNMKCHSGEECGGDSVLTVYKLA